MSLFENLSKKVSDTAKAATKKSNDLIEITKLNMNISTEEGKIEKVYAEIGKLVYQLYKEGEKLPEAFKESCERIKSSEENIKQMKDKIFELRSVKICPSCGAELELDVAFCPRCGTKQEIPKPVIEVPVPTEKICPSCSTVNTPESLFCNKCGTKLD